jgi:hypothetical protein
MVGSHGAAGRLFPMNINRPTLNRRVAIFLRSPGAGPIFDEIETSFALRLIATAIGLVFAFVAMLTIVWIPRGVRALWGILQGCTLHDPWGHLRREPEGLYPLIAYGIIIGPQGYGLVLGTFDEKVEREPEFLASKSCELARLYAKGGGNPHEEAIVELLQDDAYRRNRRRRLIEPQAERRALYLFDMHIDKDQAHRGPRDSVLVACVATPGDEGVIQQIPWRIVNDSVTV